MMRSCYGLFLSIVFLHVSGFCYEKTLAICAIFKNEARFLSEWIDYHRLVGVEEFWLYNNDSEDNYGEVLEPYIKKGWVHLIQWPSFHENDHSYYSFTVQTSAYNHCLNRIRRRIKWVALIDIDEFIVPMTGDSLPELLEREFWYVSGLKINWVHFGTSGVESIGADELMIEKLNKRAPLNYERNFIFKSIVQPEHVKRCPNPHLCNYIKGHWDVNTNLEAYRPEDGGKLHLCLDKIRLHHYWTKDEQFFREVKLPRCLLWGASKEHWISQKDSMNEEEDLEMLRFVDRLKEIRAQ